MNTDKKMLKTLVVEVPLGLHHKDDEIITLEVLEEELPAARTRVEIPRWHFEDSIPCTGFVQHHFANGKGMMIMLDHHLLPAEDDLNKISPRYADIPGIILKGRGHIFVPVGGKITWGDLRKILQKRETILYHCIIHSDG